MHYYCIQYLYSIVLSPLSAPGRSWHLIRRESRCFGWARRFRCPIRGSESHCARFRPSATGKPWNHWIRGWWASESPPLWVWWGSFWSRTPELFLVNRYKISLDVCCQPSRITCSKNLDLKTVQLKWKNAFKKIQSVNKCSWRNFPPLTSRR